MSRYAYLRDNCLESSLAARSSLDGTFDNSRLLLDSDITKINRLINSNTIPQLINMLREKLIAVHSARDKETNA